MGKLSRRERKELNRRKDAARLVERERGDGHERALPLPEPLATSDVLDQVAEVVKRQAEVSASRQPRFSQPASIFASVYRWVKELDLDEPDPRRGWNYYDDWLRKFAQREPFLMGVLNSVVQIDKNRGWNLTGGRNQVARYTNILKGVDDGAGWREYCSWQAQSYYTTRMGFISEIGRDGEGGPLRGLWSADPCRFELTGNPAVPLKYHPLLGGLQEWQPGDFFRAASLQSTDEGLYGLGNPAVRRCLELARIMVAVWEHDKEKLGAKAPKGLLLLHGIDQSDWESAMQDREDQLSEKERQYYGGVAVLATMGADDIKAELVALSQLPEQFDLEKFTNMLIYGFALAFGYDPREFWPASQGPLGTGRESDIQHQKATSKGDLDFSLAHQEKIQGLLPPALHFEYQQRDVSGEKDDAALLLAKAQVITEINKWVVAGQAVLDQAKILQLASDANLIPHEWAEAEPNVTATDTDTTDVERMLERPEVRRAIEQFPNEPLVRYEFPINRTRVLARRGGDLLVRRSWQLGGFVPRGAPLMLVEGCVSRGEWPYTAPVLRSIKEVATEYDQQLTQFVYQGFNGAMDATDMARAHRALIRSLGPAAYAEGLREGGVDPEDLDESDQTTIDAWTTNQLARVRDLAQSAVAAGSDPGLRSDVLARVLLWIDALNTLGAQGKLSAQQNAMATWKWGRTVEHCGTCHMLNGLRHRVSWFTSRGYVPRERGSQALECGGWACECGLFDDNGRRLV